MHLIVVPATSPTYAHRDHSVGCDGSKDHWAALVVFTCLLTLVVVVLRLVR